ncbi:MAG: porin family protein [Bacteroidota bacterium]
MKAKLFTGVLLTLMLFSGASLQAQNYQNYVKEFLSTQWWLGFKIGTNFTSANPTERFSGISPTNYDPNGLLKAYDDYSLAGVSAGLDITFYHKGLSIGIQPNFRRSRFSYQNELFWQGESPLQRFETDFEQLQKIDFFDIPLFFKYDLLQKKVRPFIMVGGYFSFITNAEKELVVNQRDFSSGTVQNISSGTLNLGVTNNFERFNYGVLGGVGVSYDFWNIRAVLEASYRYGLNNVTDENQRFAESQLVSIGDLNDNIELRSINVSMSFVFPLRFISKQFQAF